MDWPRLLLTLSLAGPAVACAFAAAAAQGGRVSARLDVLSHFAPIYLAVGLATTVLGLSLGGLGLVWIAAPGLAAVVGAAALMAPEYLAARQPTSTAAGPRLTLIQFNIWGGNARPQAALAWILAQQPDIVVLQEDESLGPELVAAGFEVANPQGHAAIYSRWPILSQEGPTHGDNPRAVVSRATVAGEVGEFTVFGVHRPWPTSFARQRRDMALLSRMVGARPKERTLLVGDFNSTPWSFIRRREDADLGLTRRTRALFTWPAERVSHNRLPALAPIFPIDHVYAGPGWRTVEVRRGPRLGSDHYPVVIVLAAAEGRG